VSEAAYDCATEGRDRFASTRILRRQQCTSALVPMRIAFLGYEGHPSMRLRLLQHVPRLQSEGHRVRAFALPAGERPGDALRAIGRDVATADVVVVQRILDRSLVSFLRNAGCPLVFDIDDALHFVRPGQLHDGTGFRSLKRRALERYRRIARGAPYYSSRRRLLQQVASQASVVTAGNPWLQDQVAPWARRVLVMPTTVEARRDKLKAHSSHFPVRIGWIGLRGGFPYLRVIEEALHELARSYGSAVRLTVVSSEPFETSALQSEFVPWSLATEPDSVARFDIGVMPLLSDPFALGKCAFKAILCMAHAVPVVLSPVGANRDLVAHGVDGFFADNTSDWVNHLSRLIEDPALRAQVGAAGFTKVQSLYSTKQSYPVLHEALSLAIRGDHSASRQ
jgi:glycosyltransferase involved in cell wall biosynthesis